VIAAVPKCALPIVAVSEPYVIAFSDRFYEVHSVETGELIQIVPVRNLAHLSALSNHDAATNVYALSAGSTINIIDRVNEVAPFKAAGKTMFAMQEVSSDPVCL